MPERHNDHEEHVVGDGVDDAVITDPNTETGATLQGTGGRWTRVLCQQGNGALKAVTDRRFELAQS